MPHKALWVNADATQTVKYIEGNYSPGPDELLLNSLYVGLNPADYKHPEYLGAVNTVEGFDAVGEVVKCGAEVTKFKQGDKVMTMVRLGQSKHPASPSTLSKRRLILAPYGASQEFFLTQALTSWKFDDKRISDEEAATIPVTLCTAADALYNKMDPVLPLPGTGEVCGWPILIWGGSSQVGIQAIQLAKQSGCNPVITTSSPKHFEYLKSLGANIVLDYKDPNISNSLKTAVGETPLRHIFDCVGVDPSTLTLLESLLSPQGKLLSTVPPKAAPKCRFDMCAAGIIHELSDFNLPGSRLNSMLGKPNPDAAKKLQSAVQWALDNVGGKYIPPRVRRLRGRGLYDALEAFELMRRGEISGEKVVYKMSETPEIIDGDVGL